MEVILISIYGLALLFIFCYSLVQIQLVIHYRRYQKAQQKRQQNFPADNYFPKVSVQLPIFNEKYVVNRLIDAVVKLDYPKEQLEIQVLDDSIDETTTIAKAKVEEWKARGVNIHYVHRSNRKGYKAGALAEGLLKASGEFIAIFDADFLPKEDFLQRIIPYFQQNELGMIQSRWEHLNEHYSLLTQLQAFGLNAHFSVEQGGRNAGGHFINFNGTAGVWRRKAIEEAGGWQSDTLTEDLDLSYRAQLKGWKFLFLEEVGAPAELPAAMNALKTQQFRWNKGAAECTRKNLSKVLRSKELPLSTKINATFHLMNTAVFICIVVLALLSLPMLAIKEYYQQYDLLFKLAGFFLISLPILAIFYWTSFQKSYTSKWKAARHFIIRFPLFLSISMGLSLHNALAVLEGYLGKKTPFIRTPKFNLSDDRKQQWTSNVYLKKSFSPLTVLEMLFALYFLLGILLGFYFNDFGLMPFHIMLFLGFAYVSLFSIVHSVKLSK